MSIYEDISVLLSSQPWYSDRVVFEEGMPEEIDAACFRVFGGTPERIQGCKGTAWTHWMTQLRVRAVRPKEALDRLDIAVELMDGLTNQTINGTRFRSIFSQGPPTLQVRDPGGEVTYGVPFMIVRRGR